MDCDLLIQNGTIVDGTGGPAFGGDVAVRDGRILQVFRTEDANRADQRAARTVDAAGLVVAPGFIDIHSHVDFNLPLADHPRLLAHLLEQGCTTVVAGNCGFTPAPLVPDSAHLDLIRHYLDFISDEPLPLDWITQDAFLTHLEQEGVAVNLAQLAGHATLRLSLWGEDYAYPGNDEFVRLERHLEEALDQGAWGVSLGLGYAPGLFAGTQELTRLAELAQRRQVPLTVHLKAYSAVSPAYSPLSGNHNLRALREMLDIAQQTGVRLQISHMLFVGTRTWDGCDQGLAMIEQANAQGADVAFDSFPYLCGNSTIYIAFPDWFLKRAERNFRNPLAKARLKLEWGFMSRLLGFDLDDIQFMEAHLPQYRQYEGLFFDQIAREMGCSLREAYFRLARDTVGRAACLLHKYNGEPGRDEPRRKVLTHPLCTFETDALIFSRGLANPAAMGTFPRAIQLFNKELGLLSLEETVAKMTGRSAERLGLARRGTILPGNWADLTLFDHGEIRDNTTTQDTGARPSGIKQVFINGEQVVVDGVARPGEKRGRVLRRPN